MDELKIEMRDMEEKADDEAKTKEQSAGEKDVIATYENMSPKNAALILPN